MKLLEKEKVSEFTNLPWHDAKLLELRVFRDSALNQDNLSCTIDFEMARNSWRRAVVLFQNCTIAKIDLDLDGKRVCADSIFEATCELESALKKSLEAGQLKNERQPLNDYYHFRILLVSPGGELNVFAKDFDVAWSA
ncbi:hypothetical protein [Edaphobacter flagellatus]|uniref:hypothetical protein n=1 Tax=Edaphobacter flagellatus TaxID=1933044 RepID=UPI0021B4C4F0|nr:hypothetical protein [Edaphobacter flagellatus]